MEPDLHCLPVPEPILCPGRPAELVVGARSMPTRLAPFVLQLLARVTPRNRVLWMDREQSKLIQSFRHRGLKELYERGQSSRAAPAHRAKRLRILTALDRSTNPEAIDLPGYRLHQLHGRLRGHHAVVVSANWRVTFRFDDGDVVDVDYVDYH